MIAKAPIGLHMAWFAAEFEGGKTIHGDMKWLLSQAPGFTERNAGRTRFQKLASRGHKVFASLATVGQILCHET